MCGIVGLLIKEPELRPQLGQLMMPMFTCMAERGPDSGGMAVFEEPVPASQRRFNLFVRDRKYDWDALLGSFRQTVAGGQSARIEATENHAVLVTAVSRTDLTNWLGQLDRPPHLLSSGRYMNVYKDEGDPAEIARRFQFAEFVGTHGVGHTRMATESAVTPAHSHPFTAGEDFCLVHNGSLSNPYMLRRKLERAGLSFETDNDTEAACRYLQWRMREGEALDAALEQAFRELDGFYTLLMATPHQLTLVRDAFACKPAVVAETDRYVAVGSEFRSLAHLPGVAGATIFEPAPEGIYSWQV